MNAYSSNDIRIPDMDAYITSDTQITGHIETDGKDNDICFITKQEKYEWTKLRTRVTNIIDRITHLKWNFRGHVAGKKRPYMECNNHSLETMGWKKS